MYKVYVQDYTAGEELAEFDIAPEYLQSVFDFLNDLTFKFVTPLDPPPSI